MCWSLPHSMGEMNTIVFMTARKPGKTFNPTFPDNWASLVTAHSSTLARRIPRMEEPGRLQSVGSQRVGHDWATSLHFSGSDSKSVCLQCRRPGFDPCMGEIPWRRKWQPTPLFLLGKSHGQRNLVSSMGSPRVRHNWTTSLSLLFHTVDLILLNCSQICTPEAM